MDNIHLFAFCSTGAFRVDGLAGMALYRKKSGYRKASRNAAGRYGMIPNSIYSDTSIKITVGLVMMFLTAMFYLAPVAWAADPPTQNGDGIKVMESFDRKNQAGQEAISEHKKHLIMFIIGIPLLILVIITGALGIAMVVYGKPVFLMHMIFAGLSITLVIVHAIVGLVWFNPF